MAKRVRNWEKVGRTNMESNMQDKDVFLLFVIKYKEIYDI